MCMLFVFVFVFVTFFARLFVIVFVFSLGSVFIFTVFVVFFSLVDCSNWPQYFATSIAVVMYLSLTILTTTLCQLICTSFKITWKASALCSSPERNKFYFRIITLNNASMENYSTVECSDMALVTINDRSYQHEFTHFNEM